MMNNEIFNKSFRVVHMIMSVKVREGDVAIDATMGNGNDTLFLTRLVGETGKVFAFDVQKRAIERTAELLKKNGVERRAVLFCEGHERMDQFVDQKVHLVVFNLGYLPGWNREKYTKTQTTLGAIDKSLSLLIPGGVTLIVIYPGHEEGQKEKDEILSFAKKLPQDTYNVFFLDLINQVNNPPVLVGIEKQI